MKRIECDVLVAGSGAGGLSTAVTARKGGLDVIVVEKEAVFGGTTAFSGGVLWIPGNPHCEAARKDSREAARQYLMNETGANFDAHAAKSDIPLLVDFWASWCGPCKQSFPWMNDMQARYAGKGLRVVAVNVDQKPSDAQKFLNENAANFDVVFDATPIQCRFQQYVDN